MVNAKALWESLERKYKTEDAGSKKFVDGKFLDFKMVDSKTVISQVQEFQLILHDIHAEGMVLGESFQVAALIEKLPPTWKDFKNYLKHKRKEMKLEDLIVRLRIEEDNRQSEKKAGNYHQEAKANVVEQDVLSLYPGRLSSRTVITIAGRISLKDSESNSRLDLFPLLFCNLLVKGPFHWTVSDEEHNASGSSLLNLLDKNSPPIAAEDLMNIRLANDLLRQDEPLPLLSAYLTLSSDNDFTLL
ncbi:hypothetical protein RJ639_042874 [Escallonia herrerae]|uniref:Zinc finger, CCHC-type n=1 Tax=Escallonia herrerae TaxID=1293975 RepID=A0AA89B0C7_9ASTE|nr:hypothetical protein RJ639_042874 [Escallonia herrerae]